MILRIKNASLPHDILQSELIDNGDSRVNVRVYVLTLIHRMRSLLLYISRLKYLIAILMT